MKKILLAVALLASFGASAHTDTMQCSVDSKTDIKELGNGLMTSGMAQGDGWQQIGVLTWTQDANKPDANPTGWDTEHRARLINVDQTPEDKAAAYDEKIGDWTVNYYIFRYEIIMKDGRTAKLECTPLISLNKDGSVWQ